MKIWATSLAVYRAVAIDTLFERACLPRTPIPWPIWLFNLFAHYQTVTGLLSRHNGFCSRACVRRSVPFILRALYWFALFATPVAWLRCVASFGNNYRRKLSCAPPRYATIDRSQEASYTDNYGKRTVDECVAFVRGRTSITIKFQPTPGGTLPFGCWTVKQKSTIIASLPASRSSFGPSSPMQATLVVPSFAASRVLLACL